MSNTVSLLDRLATVINAITAFTQRHRLKEMEQSDGRTKMRFQDIIPESKEELGGANPLVLEESGDDGVIEPENLGDDGAIE